MTVNAYFDLPAEIVNARGMKLWVSRTPFSDEPVLIEINVDPDDGSVGMRLTRSQARAVITALRAVVGPDDDLTIPPAPPKDAEVVGRLMLDGIRYVLVARDGTISTKFGTWETREQIAAAFAKSGKLVLREDDSVVRS